MKKRILFLGDSITDCGHLWETDPLALGDGYVRLIHDYMLNLGMDYEILNCGFDGFTSSDVLHYWQKNGKNLKPDIVTVLCGVNDIAEYYDMGYTDGLWRFTDNYRRLLNNILRDTDAGLILMEPFVFFHPPYLRDWHYYIKKEISFIQDMTRRYRAGYVPLYDGFMKACEIYGEKELTIDGMHLTKKGNELLAALWTQSVIEKKNDKYTILGI